MELRIRELVSPFLMRMNSLSGEFRWQGELQCGYAVGQKISLNPLARSQLLSFLVVAHSY